MSEFSKKLVRQSIRRDIADIEKSRRKYSGKHGDWEAWWENFYTETIQKAYERLRSYV